ncbi:Zn-ribbon domain-containing OB-fold protein [Rhodococcus sp. NPDC057014]|uniref:Zn-ribbon domain-containing OB-fold protein n=1 Tax=Rhodococcus sp. NPDC057014 TaxID=3346000 RepID=UPI003641727A
MTGRPFPTPVHWDKEFWDRARDGVLTAQECLDCGRLQHYPRPGCANCWSRNRRWRELSGRGRIYSFTVVRQPVHPAFTDEAPYPLVDVELEEGVRMLSVLRGTPLDQLSIGMPVAVEFGPEVDGIRLPYFRTAS